MVLKENIMTPTKENLDLKKQNKKPQNPPWKINPEKNKTKKSPAIKTQTTKKKISHNTLVKVN